MSSEAEDRKFDAEAKAALAQAARHAAEARKAEAEARKAEAEAAVSELAAAGTKIDLEREEEKRRRELADNDHHHVYVFSGSVTDSSVSSCIKQLTAWDRLDPGCDIEIVFMSPGGEVIPGLALFDSIQQFRRRNHQVTTVALGYAASMAGILLQSGDVRIMSKESWLLIHEVQFGAFGSMGEVEDRTKWVERIQERILDIFAARSKLSKKQLRNRWKRRDWWVDSDEALKLGLIDEIR